MRRKFTMCDKGPLILGVDLGGTKVLTSVINPGGEMLSRDHSVTQAAPPFEKGRSGGISGKISFKLGN